MCMFTTRDRKKDEPGRSETELHGKRDEREKEKSAKVKQMEKRVLHYSSCQSPALASLLCPLYYELFSHYHRWKNSLKGSVQKRSAALALKFFRPLPRPCPPQLLNPEILVNSPLSYSFHFFFFLFSVSLCFPSVLHIPSHAFSDFAKWETRLRVSH